MLITHVKSVAILVFRRRKIFMIILYKLVDFIEARYYNILIEVIRIKVFAIYAKVSFDRFGKELRFVSVCLGDFVVVAQCWIVALTLWLEEVLDFVPRLALVSLLANRVAKFFPTSLRFYPKFVFNLFLQLVNVCLYSRVFILRVLSPKPRFLLN